MVDGVGVAAAARAVLGPRSPDAAQNTVEVPDASVGGWGAGFLQASLQL